ncbi:MAG TPA: enoyl-CoA hydratase/isomerase family protein, partial [Pirellulales bacterium]|nr:enoyl-CoA hydratase/isomerase family protein [Pirellulales bacterium]
MTIDCGASSNYFNESLLAELGGVVADLTGRQGLQTICLVGGPEAFMLGVDPAFFLNCLQKDELERIIAFTQQAHKLLDYLAANDPPVVAWVRGQAIGGGLELALACRRIVASDTAKFALPETGLGIYPGLGGTQRLPRRIGPGLAKWMIYTGAIVPAPHALAIGLVDALHSGTATAIEAISALSDTAPATPGPQDTRRFAALAELFASNQLAALIDPVFPSPLEPQAVRSLIQLRGKAPIALRLAEQIIDRGLTLSLAAGL